jgi:hypothetical protein
MVSTIGMFVTLRCRRNAATQRFNGYADNRHFFLSPLLRLFTSGMISMGLFGTQRGRALLRRIASEN